MKWVFRVCDSIYLPRLFEIIWHVFTVITKLNPHEIEAASSVLGTHSIRYDSVRVAEGRLLSLIFKLNKSRAFTTFNIINLPRSGRHSRANLDIVVHELVHVCQYQIIGSIYIPQALKAQRTEGYKYGGWQQLREDWSSGKHFRQYNREQQSQIVQDYFNKVIRNELSEKDPVSQAYEPYINELKYGDL
ncbi:hypothetical protein ACFLUP_03190 [Chloroflexota bacterium]